MNVAFIVSHEKTRVFFKVSKQLEKNGVSVFWISPNYRWYKWLIKNNVANDKILDISEYGDEWELLFRKGLSPTHLNKITELESCSIHKINNLILMDRNMSKKPYNYSLAYTYVCIKYITDFLLSNNIKVVFSEQTWLLELLISMICEKYNIHCATPHVARIPDGRFLFFKGHLQSEFYKIRDVNDDDRNKAKKYLEYFREKQPKPSYWHLNNRLPKVKLDWITKTFFHLKLRMKKRHRYDMTAYPVYELILKRLREVYYTELFQIYRKKIFVNPDLNNISSPFILYTLHKQPEASVDVLGSYYSNQIETIKAIARSLPTDVKLFVKEHQNSIGDRSIKYYKEIKKIPGVVLIDPYINSHDLIKRANLVVTISGTIAYESALYKVPSIAFADMFFNDITALKHVNPYEIKLDELLNNGKNLSDQQLIDFLSFIFANSFEGIISDPVSDKRSISPENIENLSRGFMKLLSTLNGSSPNFVI